MATGVRIKLNSDGIRRALQSEPVQKLLEAETQKIADEAGDGFEAEVSVRGGSSKLGRAVGRVITTTTEARKRQAEENTLQTAVQRVRR